MDLAVTGEIYTKGSWGLAARSNYKKRYKYNGSFNASYLVTKLGDKGLPDYSKSKDFKLQWTHTQDAKANPFLSFSASVNFSTSSYDRNNTQSLYNGDVNSNTKGSSVNITKRFPNSPFTISGTMNVNQVTRDSSISVTLPDMTITMSRIYPFKRKKRIGKERWYEKVSMSYSGTLTNRISTKENLLFKSNLIRDWRNAMQHSIPVSATFTLFKYLNISPSVSYKERWYTNKITQQYDEELGRIVPKDTTYGFYRIYDYSASIAASTTLYGFFKPLPFLGNKVEMIRHRFEPSISLSGQPDFGSSRFGYYDEFDYVDAYGRNIHYTYSPFSHNTYGVPGQGKAGSVNFSIDNNIEMKIRSDKDSTGFKKISLIDKLSLSMSYNMAADSFKWSDLNMGMRLKLSKSYTLNLNCIFDTYTYDVDANGNPVRKNVTRWQAGKGFGRLRSTGTSFSYTFSNETFKKWFGGAEEKNVKPEKPDQGRKEEDEEEEDNSTSKSGSRLLGQKKEQGEYDADGYMVTSVPWSLSFSYSMRLGYGKFDPEKKEYKYKVTNSLSFNGSLQPTKNWRMNFNATYDFDMKKISYMTCSFTRNMHCWQLTGSVVPVGPYKSYSFTVAVSSSLLKDLKYDKRNNYRDGQTWY